MTQASSRESEVKLPKDGIIVSKTDRQGKITYANRLFMQISNYSEQELLAQHHNIIRHRDMPKGVFYGLWHCLKSENEFFGFVKNKTADGNYYWVFANITPDFSESGVVGYYSVRRYAPIQAISIIQSVYTQMLRHENNTGGKDAAKSSWEWATQTIQDQHNLSYEEYVLSLYQDNLEGEMS